MFNRKWFVVAVVACGLWIAASRYDWPEAHRHGLSAGQVGERSVGSAGHPAKPSLYASAPTQPVPALRSGHVHGKVSHKPPPAQQRWRRLFADLEVNSGGETLREHMEVAEGRLLDDYGEVEGKRLLEAYRLYANYVLALEQDSAPVSASIFDPSAQLVRIGHQRTLAQEMLGAQLAETLVEPKLRLREFTARRQVVLDDPELDSAAKRNALAEIGASPEGALPHVHTPLDALREEMKIHQREFASASPSEAAALKDKLRREILGDAFADGMREMELASGRVARPGVLPQAR